MVPGEILLVVFINCFCVTKSTRYDLVVVPEDVNFYPVGSGEDLSLSFFNRPNDPTNANDNENNHLSLDIIEVDDSKPEEDPGHKHVQVNNLRSLSRATPYLMHMFDQDKIVGGYDVDINDFPYHVSYGSNCAATLIDPKWAITAGHCGPKTYIKVGSKYFDKGTRYDIKNNFIHPNWGAKNKAHPFDYDYQLLELRNRVSLGKSVQPVKIGKISDMVVGVVMTVTGWGYINEDTYEGNSNPKLAIGAGEISYVINLTKMPDVPTNSDLIPDDENSNIISNSKGPYSDVLRAVEVPIVSKETCQKVSFPFYRGQLTPRMFCAGFSRGEKDACQGDSGGPAVADGKLLGIISFGYGCATPESYGVYSKVAKVRDWIETTTGLNLD